MVIKVSTILRKYVAWAAVDVAVVAVSLFLSWSGRSITANLHVRYAITFGLVAAAVYCAANHVFGLYHRIWRYASAAEAVAIGGSVCASTVILLVIDVLTRYGRRLYWVPLSVVLFTSFFAFVGFVAVRYRGRAWNAIRASWRAVSGQTQQCGPRVLIVGAGETGQIFLWRLQNHEGGQRYEVVGLVDDDPTKAGMRVHGVRVQGNHHDIPSLVDRLRVELIIIAVANISGEAFRDILSICERTSASIKVLPNVFDFIEQTQGLPPIRDVTSEDLLGRRPVEIDQAACRQLLAGKSVLVTGAAGSIGSELCRQVLRFNPHSLLMLDNNESGLHDLAVELRLSLGSPPIDCLIGDITNRAKMRAVFERHRPQIVFHAAAYKHVPMMEEHPDEAVRVNVVGTMFVIDLACQFGAERFVLISTDKAVSPSSVMGATKRIGEMLVAIPRPGSATLCTAVRFGNVLGSRGSVVPTFERQITLGGPVTITHPEMTRYFMTIAEAVSLVIQAATLTKGGDLFVLDMGEQVRIEDLAVRLIRLRGLRPGIDVHIKYTGMRPGEKLHEELTHDGAGKLSTSHPSIFRVKDLPSVEETLLRDQISDLCGLTPIQSNGRIAARLQEIARTRAIAERPRRHPA